MCACGQTRLPPQKIAVSNSGSEQDVRASGFAWDAREPKLMCGARGARILTEINRLSQPDFPLNAENNHPLLTPVTATTGIGNNPAQGTSALLLLFI